MNKLKLIYSSAVASLFSVVFITVITIWAERSKPLKDWLAGVSGHHWVTKGLFSLAIYIIVCTAFYFAIKEVNNKKINKSIIMLICGTIAGGLAIFGFYTLHYFGIF